MSRHCSFDSRLQNNRAILCQLTRERVLNNLSSQLDFSEAESDSTLASRVQVAGISRNGKTIPDFKFVKNECQIANDVKLNISISII